MENETYRILSNMLFSSTYVTLQVLNNTVERSICEDVIQRSGRRIQGGVKLLKKKHNLQNSKNIYRML